MLIIHAFSKSFNGLPVFSDISLSAEQGSFTVLLGPSGCGKSTLFDLLYRLDSVLTLALLRVYPRIVYINIDVIFF